MNLPALSTLKDSFRFSIFGFRFKRKTEGAFDHKRQFSVFGLKEKQKGYSRAPQIN
jgi:hypothetical protein